MKLPVEISADGCKNAKLPHIKVESSPEPSVAATDHTYQRIKPKPSRMVIEEIRYLDIIFKLFCNEY